MGLLDGVSWEKQYNTESSYTPTCKIFNERSSWVLEVDGKIIPFSGGGDNAEYFAELYTKLGYEIEFHL